MADLIIRIAIVGASGRMGRQLIQATQKAAGIQLGAVIERQCSSLVGIDVGELINIGRIGVIIVDSFEKVVNDFDVMIDFTRPEGTLKCLRFCQTNKKAMVIGTTGFDQKGKQAIIDASKSIPIIFSENFSVGMNVVLKLLAKAAKVIGNSTDIEIIEVHHRDKVDAPSGTALAMGESIADALGKDLKSCSVRIRQSYTQKRTLGTIRFSAIRAGDIIGDHTVMFAGIGERIEISHKASTRIIFANGAIQASAWVVAKKSGLYNMKDVLNLDSI
ncbi:4-hydroxy-tetrahydrodipicolinate reductase [Candidatus Hartigia pinicola]|nr:4-hydroxy-tetrahydrodipicolinate reductase [Candidatus Hartigia pinicola]